jgi:hypothetical protein
LLAITGHHQAALRTAGEALPESATTAAFAKGSAMGLAEVTCSHSEEASTPAPGSPVIPVDARAGQFTRGELAAAGVVARGLSNGQIPLRPVR